MSFDFRPHGKPRVGVCAHCGRELVTYPTGLQDTDGFVSCRPRGEPYMPAPRIDDRPRLHTLATPEVPGA